MSQSLWEPIPAGPQSALPLRLTLFGPVEVRVRGLSTPMTRRACLLLAALALRHPHPAERPALAGMLWPEAEEERGLFYVRRSLTELRKALGPEAERLLAPSAHTLRLDLSGAACDVAAFDAAVRRRDPASLEEAISTYRAPLLEGYSDAWLEPERAWRAEAFLAALEILAAERRRAGDPAAAVRLLRRAVAADPLRESAHRELLEALGACGDRAGVERHYRELRGVLLRELNCEPGVECTAVYRRLTAASAQAPCEPPPPPEQSAGPTRRLPCPPTPLVGRAAELKEVALDLRAARLVTLTGPGGVGKTRLAIAAAEEWAPGFNGPVWFTDLAPVSDPALVPHAVLAALGFHVPPNRTPCETLAAQIGGRQALLLLDNCEHLVEACAGLIARLLRECPEIRILATSRRPLEVSGERTRPVPPLSLPAPAVERAFEERDLHGLLESGAVRLFLDRAGAASPRFRLTAANAGAVVRVCTRLEGIPLAIELAAARVRSLAVQEIAARLDDRFSLLTGGCRTQPRHQTLRAAMDWSWRLLSEPERAVLRRLSVFAGGWTLEAAEAVSADPPTEAGGATPSDHGRGQEPGTEDEGNRIRPSEVLDLLSALVDRSLVVFEPESGEGRYRLLETVREYARERLGETEGEEAIAGRHAAFYFHLAAGWEPRYGKDAGLRVLETEYANIRAALAWSLHRPQWSVPAIHAAEGMQALWTNCRHPADGRAWWTQALAQEGWVPDTLLAKARCFAGDLAFRARDWEPAGSLFQGAAGSARETGNRAELARATVHLGILARMRHDLGTGESGADHGLASARLLLEQGLALSREVGSESCAAEALVELAWVAECRGQLQQAQAYAEEALTLYRRQRDPLGTARALHVSGVLLRTRGERSRARLRFEESLALSRSLGDRFFESWTLSDLARLAREEGRTGHARCLFEASVALRREMDDRVGVAGGLSELAFMALDQADPRTARPLLEESLALRREHGDRIGAARMLVYLGRAARQEDRLPEALAHYTEALALGTELDHPWVCGASLVGLALSEAAAGSPDRARELLGRALPIWERAGDRRGVARTLRAHAVVAASGARGANGLRLAVRLLGAAEALCEEIGEEPGLHDRLDDEPLPPALAAALDTAEAAAERAVGRALTPQEALADL